MINQKIIFIVGNSRSGTTMLGRILGNNSNIYTFGELHFFEQMIDVQRLSERQVSDKELIALLERLFTTAREGFFKRVIRGKYRDEAEKILKMTPSENRNYLSIYFNFLNYETMIHGKSIPCEQTPRYLYYVKELLTFFPNAYIINMVRDPRDVLISQKNKWKRRFLGGKQITIFEVIRGWCNYHPYTISKLWVSAVKTAERFEGNSRFMSIRFEDLVTEPVKTVQSICRFLGINFDPQMLSIPKIGSSVLRDRPEEKGIDRSRAGSWKKGGLTSTELYICQKITSPYYEKYGYIPVKCKVNFLLICISMVVWVVKTFFALLLNLKRTKNLKETFRRRLFKKW